MHFRVYPLRFSFMAREVVRFPVGQSGNLLRGAFGSIFRKLACAPECSGARKCASRSTCAYARMFEPAALGSGPSGLADWPRPFVFRATHLDGRTVEPGCGFSFDLNLFDMGSPSIAHLTLAFGQLAQYGLGPGRGLADLTGVELLDAEGMSVARLHDGKSFLRSDTPLPLRLNLLPADEPVERMIVRFVTPTELKSGQGVVERPGFGVLASRIRDRLSTLKECYDDGPLEMDFRGFGERAEAVRMTRCEIHRLEARRRSSRTGQVHSIGGFAGEVEYEGSLSEFVPFLKAARWTGVGRQTVWGKGEIRYFSL